MNLHTNPRMGGGQPLPVREDGRLELPEGGFRDEGALSRATAGRPIARSLEKRRLQCYLAFIFGDMVSILFGFMIGSVLHFRGIELSAALFQAQVLFPFFLTAALYNGSYSIGALKGPPTSITKALQALAIGGLAMAFVTYLGKTGAFYSRLLFVLGIGASAIMMSFMRMAMQGVVRWRCGERVENVLVVMDGGPPVNIAHAHVVDASEQRLRPDISDPMALDRLSRWFAPMDRVLVSSNRDRRVAWSMAMKGLAVEGEVLDPKVEEMGALGARLVNGQGFLLVSHKPLGLRDRAIKRAFDLALCIPALLILSPIMLVTALAIRMQDGGPALFVQHRTGRASRFFRIYKFRSMRVDGSDHHGERSASKGDERVTRVGRFIRRTSIDELPQLLNVVKGDMSLVGPRPHAPGSQAGDKLFWEVDDRYWQRHTLKPGLTGLAQIRGFRGATDTENDLVMRLQADLQYLDGWSIWRDLGIVFATLRVITHERAF